MQTQALAQLPSPHYPKPAALPPIPCDHCHGTGDARESERGYPKDLRVPCRTCKGAGEIKQACSCGETATTLIRDSLGFEIGVCEGCATITDGLLGEDRAVAFALAVLP